MKIVGTGRKSIETLKDKLQNKLLDDENIIKCKNYEDSRVFRESFVRDNVEFFQLKKEKHYEELCTKLDVDVENEDARIFYLSIPPFAFSSVAGYIYKYCNNEKVKDLRVAFEKPFGEDLESSLKLKESIQLDPEQCFLVDHYLGKPAVRDLINYRTVNFSKNDKPEWKPENIEKIEVKFVESLDVQGRTSFYDEYGVIRDVMQNHCMEMLVRVLMEENSVEDKNRALSLIKPIQRKDTKKRQYEGYDEHVIDETDKTSSLTPTEAYIKIHLKDEWKDVEVFMQA
eukprot:UN25386